MSSRMCVRRGCQQSCSSRTVLLLAVVCFVQSLRTCAAQTGVVNNLDDLRAAAFAGGTYVVNANLQLAGSLSLNGTNTSLTLLGNTTACGGLCVLDAQELGGHFVVSMGYTLTVDSIAFVNSLRGRPPGDPCLGGIVRGTSIGDALTVSRNCASGQLKAPYFRMAHLNDLPCGFLRCSSIIVAANSSLFVNNSLFANNTGDAGEYGAMGAAISIVATAADGFSIQNTRFVNNVVQDFAEGSWGNSGGAISIDQPFSSMNYPIAPRLDRPELIGRGLGLGPSSPHIVKLMQILNCTFTQNQAARGGALFLALNGGTINITGSTFEGNVALGTLNWLSALGGALYVHEYVNSRPFKALVTGDYTTAPDIRFPLHPQYIITECQFINNAARPKSVFLAKGTQTVAAKGGAVAAESGGYGLSFVNCNFVGNTATNGGALFYSGNSRTNDVFLYNVGVFDLDQVNDYFDGVNLFYQDYASVQPNGGADYLSLAPYAEETTYMLSIESCTFSDNTAASGVAAATGGALHIDCGTAVVSGSLFTANSIISTGTIFDVLNSGGALFATNDCLTADTVHLLATNVTVLNSSFVSNQASASGAAVASRNRVFPESGLQGGTIEFAFVGSSFANHVGSQLGGALYLDVTSHATLLRCNFTSNAAVQGGAVYALGGAGQHALTDSIFQNNSASLGGAVAAAGTSVLATRACLFASNMAVNGSGIAVLTDGAAVVSTGDSFVGNVASAFGAAIYDISGNLTISAANITGNQAQVGAGVFSASAASTAAAVSVVAAEQNEAVNYGAAQATLPSSFALLAGSTALPLLGGASLTAKSGVPLNLTITMADELGNAVSYWQDLNVDVSCALPCPVGTLQGSTHAVYFSSSAALPNLAVSGAIGATFALALRIASPSIALFGSSGLVVNMSVVVAPCGAFQVFQNMLCVCAPGAFLNGERQQCQACDAGFYAPIAGALACTVCAPGSASIAERTTCTPCPAGTFLNALTQSCDKCAVGLVTTSTGAITCSKCPLRFAWASNSLCIACPSNSGTSPNDPAQCACAFGYYDALFGANLTAPSCVACPPGGVCTSGYVGAAAGFWRETTLSASFYRCREGNCVEEDVIGPLSNPRSNVSTARRALLQLSGNASVPSNCADGNTGPLCALCLPGYSLQSGVCAPCDPKDAFDNWSSGSKCGLLIGCIIAGILILAFGLFQPLSPGLEGIAAAVVAAAHSVKDALVSCVTCARRRSRKPPPPPPADEKAVLPAKAAPAPHSSDKHEAAGSVTAARNEALDHTLNSNVAFGLGMAMADDDDRSNGDGSEGLGHMDAALDGMDELEELLEKLQKYMKILVNFYQIVSTFLKSLDIPWPNIFGVIMARVNVVNLNLVQLPKTACLNPSPSFYKQFNGYTLGLVCAMLGMPALHVLGTKVVSPLSLRGLSEEERIDRVARFSSLLLARALLVLYIVYPGVSVAIFSMFSCTKLESGVAYLDSDFNITCYDQQHRKYVGAAVVWLFIVPIGVPAFFIWLLRHFKVPQMANLLTESAWVREAVKLAWQSGMTQPVLDAAKLNVDSISDAHLEGLYALFVRKASVAAAGDVATGAAPPLPDEIVPEAPPPTGAVGKAVAALTAAAASAAAALQRVKLAASKLVNSDAGAHGDTPEEQRRAFLLGALLAWCQTSGKLSLQTMTWEEMEEEEEEQAEMPRGVVINANSEEQATETIMTHAAPQAVTAEASVRHKDPPRLQALVINANSEEQATETITTHAAPQAVTAKASVRHKDLPRLQARAMKEVGFLFAAYRSDCWYWEVVELMRKLLLTSILALIAPGSAGQVVVGLLLAFCALLFNVRLKPYAEDGLNVVSQISQLNLFFFLFVALLLKVNMDGKGDSGFFSYIVGFMSIVPIALPILIKAYLKFFGGGLEAKMITKDAAWN